MFSTWLRHEEGPHTELNIRRWNIQDIWRMEMDESWKDSQRRWEVATEGEIVIFSSVLAHPNTLTNYYGFCVSLGSFHVLFLELSNSAYCSCSGQVCLLISDSTPMLGPCIKPGMVNSGAYDDWTGKIHYWIRVVQFFTKSFCGIS